MFSFLPGYVNEGLLWSHVCAAAAKSCLSTPLLKFPRKDVNRVKLLENQEPKGAHPEQRRKTRKNHWRFTSDGMSSSGVNLGRNTHTDTFFTSSNRFDTYLKRKQRRRTNPENEEPVSQPYPWWWFKAAWFLATNGQMVLSSFGGGFVVPLRDSLSTWRTRTLAHAISHIWAARCDCRMWGRWRKTRWGLNLLAFGVRLSIFLILISREICKLGRNQSNFVPLHTK